MAAMRFVHTYILGVVGGWQDFRQHHIGTIWKSDCFSQVFGDDTTRSKCIQNPLCDIITLQNERLLEYLTVLLRYQEPTTV